MLREANYSRTVIHNNMKGSVIQM